MKTPLLISPAYDIIEFAADILLQDPDNLSKNLIVFPGKRPGHFLRKYVYEKLKKPFESPAILSMDEFVDFVYANLGYSDRIIGPIDGVPIIFEFNKIENLINDDGVPLNLDEFLPWGFKLFSDFEEMHIEGIAPSKLKEVEVITGENLSARMRGNLTALSSLYRSFYEQTTKLNLSTRSSRYQKVAQNIKDADFNYFKRILFVGFFALTNSEKKILKYLTQLNNIIFILQKGTGIASTIKSLDIEVEEKNLESNPPELKFYQTMDVHGEIFKLSQIISQKKKFDHKDVIVLPLSDTLFPVIQHTLGFADSNYNISMGYPLLRTPVYALVQTLGRLLETRSGDEYYIPDYLNFVLHPYIKNIYLEQASYASRIVFHTIEELFVEEQKRFATLKEIEDNDGVIKACIKKLQKHEGLHIDQQKVKNHLHKTHTVLIRPFENITNIEDFGDKLLTFFSFLSENSPANLHPYTSPFIKTMLEALYELKTSGLKNERFRQTHSYFRFLKNYVRTIRYPFSGTPVKGLQILGFLETRNIKFNTVYLLDTNEGIIPHTAKEDTMLPHQVRKYLGMPTYEAREKIAHYYFETLIAGAKEAHIFYVEGADKEKSRFVEKLIWQSQKKTGQLDASIYDVFFDVQFNQPETEAIKKREPVIQLLKNISFTPSKLDSYLHCPLQFYYTHILLLKEKEEISKEVEPKTRGSIVHRVLMKFFINKIGEKLVINDTDYEFIEKLVDEEFEKNSTDVDKGPIFLIKSQIKTRMKEVLDLHREKNYRDVIILECENENRPGIVPKYPKFYKIPLVTKSGHRVALSGRIDRVDRRGEEMYIVDYKTGANEIVPNFEDFDILERNQWHKTLGSVQLPAYILLYQGKNKNMETKSYSYNSGLMLLGASKIKEKKLFAEKTLAKERGEIIKIYKEAIHTLIDEILDPQIDFTPSPDPEKYCPACSFKVICGRQWMLKKW